MYRELRELLCRHEWKTQLQQHIVCDETDGMSLGEAVESLYNFKYWNERYHYCPKCHKEIHSSLCDHDWRPVKDDHCGPVYLGIKAEKIAVCSKCGTILYRVFGKPSKISGYTTT